MADILTAWWNEPKPAAVRSSALIEDRADTNFAGQFESFLGVNDDTEFLTTLRACWAALWTTNARRYMAQHDLDPADTAMAVLVQPLVAARASGGGLSETADGHMLLSATWGLGSAIAQGEVVPDRVVLSRHGFLRSNEAGRKHHREACVHGAGTLPQAVPEEMVRAPCLEAGQATTLGAPDAQGRRRARHGRSRSNGRSTMLVSNCCRRGRCASSSRTCPTRSG